MSGLFVTGMFCGTDQKEFTAEDGTRKVTNYVLVSSGSDFYKMSVDQDYRDLLEIGSTVTFKVRPRVFKERIYYYGELSEEQ